MKHTLAVLVENRPGVLSHIASLISRRNYNIESIAAGLTEEPDVTRITLVVEGDEQIVEQVVKQLSKLIDVISVTNLTHVDSINRELALIKVRATPEKRTDLMNVVEVFRARIVDMNRETVVVELTGEEDKIDALCRVLEDHGIVEMVRTGRVSLNRGPLPVKEIGLRE